jgi:hypothetical protein
MQNAFDFIQSLPNVLYTVKNQRFVFFKQLVNDLNIKPYYEPEYLADLKADGFTPDDFPELFDDFGQFIITEIKFFIENGLYIINPHFDTTDSTTLCCNKEQLRDFLFICFYNYDVKKSLSPVSSPRNYYF